MTPREQFEAYCSRYGVPHTFGERLLPLLEKAHRATPEVRERILGIVEASFEKEAERRAWRRTQSQGGSDARVLRSVADVLHAWDPPGWLERGDGLQGPTGDDQRDSG